MALNQKFTTIFHIEKKSLFTKHVYLKYSTKIIKRNKIAKNVTEALTGLKDGDTLLVGGFGFCGIPEHLISGIVKQRTKDLTLVSLVGGREKWGTTTLIGGKLVKRLVTSYAGENRHHAKLFFEGELEIEFIPMGTLVESLRAGGAGIPAFYTPCGVGTFVQNGGIPIKYAAGTNKQVAQVSLPQPTKIFNGREYILKTAITGDFGIAKAWRADPSGNLMFRKTARNINTSVLKAAKIGVAEVEEIVPLGSLDPNNVHLPGIYVDRILLGDNFEKCIEKRVSRSNWEKKAEPLTDDNLKTRIGKRVAMEFKDGMYINIGIGIPCVATEHIPEGINVTLHGENGVLGVGPNPTDEEIDPDMINPSLELSTYVTGASFSDSEQTFALIRGGHLDLTVLGSMQVSQYGDLANWIIPGKLVKGMGGAMDLVSAERTKVIVAMLHTTTDGSPKILPECNLPLTGRRVVDLIITEKCVFEIDAKEGLTLTELAEEETVDTIRASTGCEFKVSSNLKPMELP